MRNLLLLCLLALSGPVAWAAGEPAGEVIVYKSPTCGCCGKWVAHMREHGFSVTEVQVDDVTPYKRRHGVPAALSACHTALAGGYVIEGHVPAADVKELLRVRPDIVGLAVPGMPLGSPGMEVPGRAQPFEVLAINRDDTTYTFSAYNQP